MLFKQQLKVFYLLLYCDVVVRPVRHVRLFVTPWTAAQEVSLSSTVSRSLLKFMSIQLVMLDSHLLICHPLLLSLIFPSISVFSNESALYIRWPGNWSFSFIISLSSEYSQFESINSSVLSHFFYCPTAIQTRKSVQRLEYQQLNLTITL